MKRFDDKSHSLLKARCGAVPSVISVRDCEEAERTWEHHRSESVSTENVTHVSLYEAKLSPDPSLLVNAQVWEWYRS